MPQSRPRSPRLGSWPPTALVAALALLVAACGSNEPVEISDEAPDRGAAPASTETDSASDTSDASTENQAGAGSASDAEAAASGGNVLVAALGSAPDQLDPHLATTDTSLQVLENVYDTLVQPGDDLSMEPALAESWTVSADNLTWTFTLRDDVMFHNGRVVTADDVVYSFERIMDPGTEATTAWRFEAVEEVVAIGDLTVDVVLRRPAPNLLASLGADKGMAIVAREIVDDGSISTSPVGTGPFRFVSSSPETGVVLEANPDYWRAGEGLPRLDGIRFVPITDETAKLASLRAGEVDWVDRVPPQQLADLEGDPAVMLDQVAGGEYHYVALNHTRPPFDDVRVRQAIAMAIDRQAIAEVARPGAASANQTAIPQSSFWYHNYAPFTTADTAGAEALLDEARVFDLTIELMVSSDYPETVAQAEVIATQLEEIGIAVELADFDFGTWLSRQQDGDFDAFLLSWVGNVDPDDFYYAQHHSEGEFNFQGYDNPAVDDLLDEARLETDRDARKALYDEAVELIVDEVSYIHLYNPLHAQAWAPNLTGYRVRSDNAARFVETSRG